MTSMGVITPTKAATEVAGIAKTGPPYLITTESRRERINTFKSNPVIKEKLHMSSLAYRRALAVATSVSIRMLG
jgi:hypothetical protein